MTVLEIFVASKTTPTFLILPFYFHSSSFQVKARKGYYQRLGKGQTPPFKSNLLNFSLLEMKNKKKEKDRSQVSFLLT